ncbi:MAG TPA: helix-turn-helix transcriptional regulator [Tepidisphaeraceae bacterium]|jgi:DNA-binding CsgD family transcriptional regulator
MPQSRPPKRLRLRDIRNVFRLIGEVRELGADPKVWRPHMIKRLRELFGAEIVISSEVHAQTTKVPGKLKMIDIGWGCDSEANLWDIHTERDDENLEEWRIAAGHVPEDHAHTPTEDQTGAVEVPVHPIKPVYGGKSFVLSQYSLPHIMAVDQLGLHRAYGDAPFSPAEHRLVRLFHTELGRLWKRDVLREAKDPTHDLPPRLSQTLAELLSGKSEKEIAARLELSRHTIHNYVKALHQRFEVSSRGELLAKVGAATKPDFTPRLSITLPRPDKSPTRKE